MTDFWIKEAIDILRQNGSQEPADAVESLAASCAQAAKDAVQFQDERNALEARLAESEHWLRKVVDDHRMAPQARLYLARLTDSADACPRCKGSGKVLLENLNLTWACPDCTTGSADVAQFAADLAARQKPLDPVAAKVLHEERDSLYVSASEALTHLCYFCHTNVIDGTAYCGHCGTKQPGATSTVSGSPK